MAVDPLSPSRKNYGFVIDNRKCIGCHACSVACKSENEVPLTVNRTWVKYVETGIYPHSRRHFQVTRCNHCANPPCVRICPTEAMYQRADGIVEFDNRVCIGCKACLQACPYDAIYIDPDTHTAAKCHYCAHRTDIGLEPACVVVCPEHAIIAGDINDPDTEIAQLLARQPVTVRKPEQGTAPKLFYIHGSEVSLHPTATERAPETFLWADVLPLPGAAAAAEPPHHASGSLPPMTKPRNPALTTAAADIRPSQAQGQHWRGPIELGGAVAEHMVQVSYNAQHKIPWHWPVPAYLVTKGIGAGIFLILAFGWLLRLFPFNSSVALVGGFLSLLFIGATTGLLVYDLEKPERFLYILRRPQWKSWLARGAVLLIGFSIITALWWLFELGSYLFDYTSPLIQTIYLWLGIPFALGSAIYTAFLFAQAEGRDLWQSPLLPFHLVVQAALAGSAALLLVDLLLEMPAAMTAALKIIFTVALLVDLFVTLVGEFSVPHASEVAARAAHEISHGRYRRHFWLGGIALGHLLPLALLVGSAPLLVGSAPLLVGSAPLLVGSAPLLLAANGFDLSGWLAAVAGICAIAGLYLFEYAFVMAPQEVPNS